MHVAARARQGQQLDEIAEALAVRVSTLSKLFFSQSRLRVSRTEAGVLQALSEGPCRVTALAAREGVTQPAITVLAKRMGARGWVRRESDPLDGRVVLVALTEAGRDVWQRLRREYRALLREELASLPSSDVDALARASEIFGDVIHRLQDPADSAIHG